MHCYYGYCVKFGYALIMGGGRAVSKPATTHSTDEHLNYYTKEPGYCL